MTLIKVGGQGMYENNQQSTHGGGVDMGGQKKRGRAQVVSSIGSWQHIEDDR